MRDFEKLALDGLKNFISGCAIGGSITFFVPRRSETGAMYRQALREIFPAISLGCFIKKLLTINSSFKRVRSLSAPRLYRIFVRLQSWISNTPMTRAYADISGYWTLIPNSRIFNQSYEDKVLFPRFS